jgi:hypothetical protein
MENVRRENSSESCLEKQANSEERLTVTAMFEKQAKHRENQEKKKSAAIMRRINQYQLSDLIYKLIRSY